MTTAKPRTYTAPALEKGLEILELLADVKEPLTLVQIAAKLNRSKSELYRMLAVLETKGYLAREEGSDHFYITNRLFDLGMSVPPVGTLVEAAFPIMHRLADFTHQPCHLAIGSGHRMVVIARVESPSSLGLSVRVGHSLNLFESSSGFVLMAWMEQQKREKLFQYFEANSDTFNRAELEPRLAAIREQKCLRMQSAVVAGIEDMSCPIYVGDYDHVVAGLTIPYLCGINTGVTPDETLEALKEAASEISALAQSYGGF